MTISIKQQAEAVEISAVNLRGHVDNLTYLVERKKRPQVELDIVAQRVPALEAAAQTMRWLERNEAAIRERVQE